MIKTKQKGWFVYRLFYPASSGKSSIRNSEPMGNTGYFKSMPCGFVYFSSPSYKKCYRVEWLTAVAPLLSYV